MFTGLIVEVGRLSRITGRHGNRLFEVEAGIAGELAVGDSVAVNGCCLTVTALGRGRFTAEAVATTLATTTLGGLRAGAQLNLERPLALGDRFDGHVVQGHVDEVGAVRSITREPGQWLLDIRVSRPAGPLLVERGSVAVDGVSLTIARAGVGEFRVNIIPHTWEHTRFPALRVGSKVNVEYDYLTKAIQNYLIHRHK